MFMDKEIPLDIYQKQISTNGVFVHEGEVALMRRAAGNLGGITVEELGDTLVDGTKTEEPVEVGVRVKREDGQMDLREFWTEVDRLAAETEKVS